jgi:hypothetical protein
MLKMILPDTPVSSNTKIPSDSMIIEQKERLKYYEFDVSFFSLFSADLNDTLSSTFTCI